MPLEKRFAKRLQRTTTGADDEQTPAAPLQKRGRPMGKYQGVLHTWPGTRFPIQVTGYVMKSSDPCKVWRSNIRQGS